MGMGRGVCIDERMCVRDGGMGWMTFVQDRIGSAGWLD